MSVLSSASSSSSFASVLRAPDLVRAFGADGEISLERSAEGVWGGSGVEVRPEVHADRVEVRLRAQTGVTRLQLRWRGDLRAIRRYLGDHWERSYGDLEWRGEAPNRAMPWYFMANDGHRTHGYGVRTQPSAFCFWTADRDGISLWADVRNGGSPVLLGDRTLDVCTVLCREGAAGESAFAATHAFCRQMCPNPRLPKQPVYGANDWYFAYGHNSADLILSVSETIAGLAPDMANRPFSVIDDGWSKGGLGTPPWEGNERFGDMGAFAARLRSVGVVPGIWFRPLTSLPDQPESWRLPRHREHLDPSVPEVLEVVKTNVGRLRDWGYAMIKHDFTSFDITGRWGSGMGASVTADGWRFADSGRTTAEIVLALYRTIREAAGDVLVNGCNTFSHLTAGMFELYRVGDDTSGRDWDRTRRMGVNTLAFRAAQNGAFYATDADVAAITREHPWDLGERWLRLVAESGTPLFVSSAPDATGPEQKAALREAFATAAKPRPTAEPLDWMDTLCPSRWRLNGREVDFDWIPPAGGSPFPE